MGVPILAFVVAAAAGSSDPAGTAGIMAMLGRVLNPEVATSFTLRLQPCDAVPAAAPGREADPSEQQLDLAPPQCGTIRDGPGHTVVLSGNSVSSIGFVAGKYLERHCNTSLSWVKTGKCHLPLCLLHRTARLGGATPYAALAALAAGEHRCGSQAPARGRFLVAGARGLTRSRRGLGLASPGGGQAVS